MSASSPADSAHSSPSPSPASVAAVSPCGGEELGVASASASSAVPCVSASGFGVPSSAERYPLPPGYSPLSVPNPFAHVAPAPVVPLTFPEPRRPVRYEEGWEFFRRIGSPKYICAPMVNQSELAFRLLCRRYNTTHCYSPMMHAEIFGKDPKYREDAMQCPKDVSSDRPLTIQFCGHDPQTILKAAKLVEQQCDAVDLNCGCPQGIAKRGFYGAFLLEHTQLLHDIVSTLHQYLSIPITVKIRRLPRDEDTIALVKMLQEAGAALITIHGRSRLQLKDKVGQCDFDIIRAVKQNCAVPVFANGGIYDFEDVQRCLDYTGVDGVMSSEALLCNPSLFAGRRVESLSVAREYMEIVEQLEKQEGIVTEQSMVRGHLFKILFRYLHLYTDLRDRLGACPPEDFSPILTEITSRWAEVPEAEKAAKLESVPVWYHRHIPTVAQQRANAEKAAQKRKEQLEREACAEEGLCDAGSLWGEE